jgi:hypothetical protein
VLAGLIGSQAPEFAQQYRQRLGGALDELNRIVSEFDVEAQRQNLARAEAPQRLKDNSDPLARERGEDMDKAIERAERLNQQIGEMNSAGPLMRLYVVGTNFDPEIAQSTLDNYEPAEPLSLGALTAGGLAALWGWAATRLIAWPFSRRFAPQGRNRGRRTRDRPARLPGHGASNLREGDHARIGSDYRSGHPRQRQAVAMRVGDRQGGRALGGLGHDGRQVLRLRHAGSQIRECRLRQLDRVRSCA